MKDFVDVFALVVGDASSGLRGVEAACWDHRARQHYGAHHARPEGQGPMRGVTYVVSGRLAP
jgi:hypothetical protein